MTFSSKIDIFHWRLKQNRWLGYFTLFNRIALAAGFLAAGYVKVIGERFTDLHNDHPMGHYLEALHMTGYYYTFIGIIQITAALFLLIPRTATLGAVIYFPIILNICILSHSVCFIGSLHSSPLMVLANLYLLCWDYDKLKYILPFGNNQLPVVLPKEEKNRNNFPIIFFSASFAAVIILIITINNLYDIEPYNTIEDCKEQCRDSSYPEACENFCNCIHNGQPYYKCRDAYHEAIRVK